MNVTSAGTNWAGNLTYRASRVVRPTSIDELREVLAGDGPFRVLGSRHSFNDIADTEGTLIEAEGLPVDIDSSSAPGVVRIAGNPRYGELAAALHARGLALGNLA